MTSPNLDQLTGVLGDFGIKAPCRVVATSGLALTGLVTIDGVTVAVSDRVLVTGQSDTTLNGIYLADTGNWALSLDFNSPQNVARGTLVFVTDGSTNSNTLWHIVATNPVQPQAPSSPSAITITKISFGSGNPGGSSGQIEYNNGGSFGGFTMSGDATINTSTGVLTLAGGAVANLNTAVGDSGAGVTKGLVPSASTGNATTAFLRKDMTYAIPAGTGGDVFLAQINAFTKSQGGPTGTLTISASHAAWDASTKQIASLTLNSNATLDNPSNLTAGQTYILKVTQSGGSHTLAFGTVYKWPGGTAPTISVTDTAIDVLTFYTDGTNMYGNFQQAFA